MNKKQKLNNLKKVIKQNKDGFTCEFRTLKQPCFKSGYAIGITNLKAKNPLRIAKKVLLVASGFKQIEKSLFIGGWFCDEDKNYYIDLSLIEQNKERALYLKELFKQKSIFDFKTFGCL